LSILILVTACGSSVVPVRKVRVGDAGAMIDASDLAREFESNELQAAQLYVGKRLRITGQFARSEAITDGRTALIFKTSKETFRPVHCVLSSTEATDLKRFSNGDEVTVAGEILGFAESKYFVAVDECVVE
jgi:hypothetical protein